MMPELIVNIYKHVDTTKVIEPLTWATKIFTSEVDGLDTDIH